MGKDKTLGCKTCTLYSYFNTRILPSNKERKSNRKPKLFSIVNAYKRQQTNFF